MPFLLNSENIFQYLAESNLVTEQGWENLQVEPGKYAKNFSLLVTLSPERKFLVKQERYWRNGKTANEFFNEWQFHELLRQFPALKQLRSTVSEVIYFDEEHSIIVYNYLINYQDLSQFYQKEQVFPTFIAATIGNTLAVLHRTTLNRQECCDFFQLREGSAAQFHNPVQDLERPGPEIFGSIPDDCLKFFVLYQRYKSLKTAVADLTGNWYCCCVTHNDLKFNNILLHQTWERFLQGKQPQESPVRLIDWERSTWGDPAFDLGTVLASYLQLWLNSLIADPSVGIEESLRRAVIPLKLLRPSMNALTEAYLDNFPEILECYPNFLQRVIQFAGLALVESIRAQIDYQKRFSNISIYMLQVAKTLLCRPNQSFTTIFNTPETKLTGLQ